MKKILSLLFLLAITVLTKAESNTVNPFKNDLRYFIDEKATAVTPRADRLLPECGATTFYQQCCTSTVVCGWFFVCVNNGSIYYTELFSVCGQPGLCDDFCCPTCT
jgi:hypothetical protein